MTHVKSQPIPCAPILAELRILVKIGEATLMPLMPAKNTGAMKFPGENGNVDSMH